MEMGGTYYIETDYSKFKKLECNRIVTKSRLSALIDSFRGGVVLTLITVNKNMEIIDGQGRFEARKALGLPILYVIDPDADINDCRRINTANKPWTLEDYIVSFAESGNENYINLLDCRDQTKMSFNLIIRLANRASKKGMSEKIGSSGNIVTSGGLVFTKQEVCYVVKLKKQIMEIAQALDKTIGLNEAFWVACKVAIETEGYNHSRMLSGCKVFQTQYTQMSKLEDELKMLSKIYNYRRSGNNKLYFEDYMRNRGYNVRDYKEQSEYRRENVSTL